MSFILLLGQKTKTATAVVPDPRRSTGLLFAYNLDETDDGTRYPFDAKGPDLDTVVNAPDDVTGIIGEALQGDGTQYVKSTATGIDTDLDGLQHFSLSYWYKRTDTSAGFNQFVNWGYQEPNPIATVLTGTVPPPGGVGGYSDYSFYMNGTRVYRVYEYYNNSPRVLGWYDEEWHHLLFTFDGEEASAGDRVVMYFDDVDVSTLGLSVTTSGPTSLNQSRSEMEIGAGVEGGQPMSGAIDLVGLWNWTMTPTDVTYEYNGGSAQAFVAE
jgi:hypothetical protein